MPIEAKYPLPAVVEAALRYPVLAAAVTFEYVLLGGSTTPRPTRASWRGGWAAGA